MDKKIKTAKILISLFIPAIIFFSNTNKSSAETNQAHFQAKIIYINNHEADIKVTKVDSNDFELAPDDFIHVSFKESKEPLNFQSEDLVSGTIFHFEAEVNHELVDSYIVTDYNLEHRPLFKHRTLKLIYTSTALFLVITLIILEKKRQRKTIKLP